MFHTVKRWAKNAGFTLKTMWRARKHRAPREERYGNQPVTFYPPHEIEAYYGGVTCGDGACARPVPSKNHADDHINTFAHDGDAQVRLFRTVAALQRARSKR